MTMQLYNLNEITISGCKSITVGGIAELRKRLGIRLECLISIEKYRDCLGNV